MVLSFLAVAQSAPFPNWENAKPDYFLQPQELGKGVTLANYLRKKYFKDFKAGMNLVRLLSIV